MFSRLDSLFTGQLRHAETLDTKQAIRRHEDQPGREKKPHEETKEDASDLWEDRTTVSVRALKSFLEQLLKTAQAKTPSQAGQAGTEAVNVSPAAAAQPAPHETAPRHVSEQSARAASAYQRTYRATHADAQAPAAPGAIPAIDLNPGEIRIMHRLVIDLGKLADDGTELLVLNKSESFLQSLVDAVEAARKD